MIILKKKLIRSVWGDDFTIFELPWLKAHDFIARDVLFLVFNCFLFFQNVGILKINMRNLGNNFARLVVVKRGFTCSYFCLDDVTIKREN